MKKSLSIAAFLGAVFIMAVTGVAVGHFCFSNGRSLTPVADQVRIEDAGWLIGNMKLNQEQAKAVRALEQEYRNRLTASCATHCAARTKMRDILLKPEANANQTRALVESMAKAQGESDLATVEHLRKINALLTPDQRKKFETLTMDCICGKCPTGLHDCAIGRTTAP